MFATFFYFLNAHQLNSTSSSLPRVLNKNLFLAVKPKAATPSYVKSNSGITSVYEVGVEQWLRGFDRIS